MNASTYRWMGVCSWSAGGGWTVVIECDERVPADCILLRALSKTEENGDSLFVRTDQLDGETDWKVRRAVHATQKLTTDADVLFTMESVFAEAPKKEIYDFTGNFNTVSVLSPPLSLFRNEILSHPPGHNRVAIVVLSDNPLRKTHSGQWRNRTAQSREYPVGQHSDRFRHCPRACHLHGQGIAISVEHITAAFEDRQARL